MTDTHHLSAIFNAFAKRVVHDFPHLNGKIVIADMHNNTYYGDINPALTNFNNKAQAEAFIGRILHSNRKLRSSFAHYDKNHDFSIIAFDATNLDHFSIKQGFPPEIAARFILEHELGHLTVKNAYAGNNFAETAADLFSCLCHMKRHGLNTPFVKNLSHMRAGNFIFGEDKKHFTSLPLTALEWMKKRINLDAMNPAQMATLAYRIAKVFTPSPTITEKAYATFFDARAAAAATHKVDETSLRTLAETTLDPKSDYLTFKTGCIFLEKFFSNILTIKPEGDYWQDVRTRLADRNKHFRAEEKKVYQTLYKLIESPDIPSRASKSSFSSLRNSSL